MRRNAGALFADLAELFARAYEATYTLRLDEPAEIVNWKVEAAGPAPNLGTGYACRGRPGLARQGRAPDWPTTTRRMHYGVARL